MGVWSVVRRLAALQCGVVATSQLTALGLAASSISRRTRRDGWDRLHHGVWALPGSTASPLRTVIAAVLAVGRPSPAHRRALSSLMGDAEDLAARPRICGRCDERTACRDRGCAEGVLRRAWAHPPAIGVRVTGVWAAWLLGLTDRVPTGEVELVLPQACHLTVPSGVRVRRAKRFDLVTRTTVGVVPVTGVNWTLCDLGLRLDPEQLAITIACACRKRRTSLASLQRALDRRGRFPGCGQVRTALRGLRGELVHSGTERRFRTALRGLALVVHPEPLDLYDNGVLIAQADIALVDVRLDVELDGPHHLMPAQAARDRVRDRRLKRTIDWDTMRFSVFEVDRDVAAAAREVAEAWTELTARASMVDSHAMARGSTIQRGVRTSAA